MFIVQIILTVVFSVAIGLFMGVIGGGGGGIYVVVLMVLLHQNAKTAAMTALVLSTITLSGAAWQYCRKKQFRMDYFLVLSVLDIIGTLLGAALMNHINENALKIIILCVLVLSGLSSLVKIKESKPGRSEITTVIKKMPIATPIGLTSGLITGATGLSASTMLSSLLIGLLNFEPFLAVGTTTLVSFTGNLISIVLLLLSGFMLHSSIMHIDIETLFTFGIGSAVGAVFGAKLTSKIDRKVLAIVLTVVAIVPGIYLAIKR